MEAVGKRRPMAATGRVAGAGEATRRPPVSAVATHPTPVVLGIKLSWQNVVEIPPLLLLLIWFNVGFTEVVPTNSAPKTLAIK